MKITNLTILTDDKQYAGYNFEDLPLEAAYCAACEQIDMAADRARLDVVGDPLRAMEYKSTAHEAKAFAVLAFKGEVPPTVQSWADACGITPQAAAESIILKADAWDAALYAIRDTRLKGKEAVKKLLDHHAVLLAADAAINIIQKRVEGIEVI